MSVIRGAAVVAAISAALPAHAADSHSYANTDAVTVSALALDLKVDFRKKQLIGSAELKLDWHDPKATSVVLDTRDLSIDKVETIGADGTAKTVRFSLAKADATLGSALTIPVEGTPSALRITYHTSPQASGLQWMAPALTANKKYPFMFSQSQAIHARSWVPLQDTPSVRFTYSAHLSVPTELRAVMSADNDAKHPLDGDFDFVMKQPIPSYLLAIAVGDIAVKETGPRTAIYAEPSVVDKAAKEFEDTEKMIATAEKIFGPYRWDRYDILVLPASFPFGGMENPRLTFATPTVLAGDKSLVSLIAHELAHSWSGNLVTNANWNNIWLNEGFTTYVENRIVEAVYGKAEANMQLVVDDNELLAQLPETKPAEQVLLPDLKDVDPDDGLSDIPYIKGRWFLRFLESRYGRDVFDPFLRGYFDHFAFQSITTDQFRAYYDENLAKKYPDKVSQTEVDEWLTQPGIPANAPVARSANFDKVDQAREAWIAGTLPALEIPAKAWVTCEWLHFINSLPEKLTTAQIEDLDGTWKLSDTTNAEIAYRWFELTVNSGYVANYPQIERFVVPIGRRKLVNPIYEALAKTP
ncbi:MAG: M1 family metallopeptidase, partial [Dokdonella sp.]